MAAHNEAPSSYKGFVAGVCSGVAKVTGKRHPRDPASPTDPT